MASASVNYVTSVPKLKGRENYDEWAFAAENFLILDGLQKCIEGKEEDGEKIARAKAKLILTIDTSLYVHIKETKTAEELWKKLKGLFDDSGFTRKINLLRALISTKLENCDSMGDYVNQIVETSQRLRGTGFKIDEEWVGSLLLAGLPEKFAPMIMAIEHSGILITTDSIKTKLLDMEVEIGAVGNTGNAFVSRATNRNDRCRNVGNAGTSVRNTTSAVRKDIQCYGCKQTGHFKNRCPNKAKTANVRNENKHAFSAVFLSGQFCKEDWYIDSGASVHLTVNREWLTEESEPDNIKEIAVANNMKVPVECAGNVDITTVVGRSEYSVTIKDALCVPQLTTNLLSVSQLIKKGNRVVFETKGCRIYNRQEELIAVADLENEVYKLNVRTPQKQMLAAATVATGKTWHRRLGHINSNSLQKMKDGAVKGLKCKGDFKFSKNTCIPCNEGKQHRLSFPERGTRAETLLEIIHADVCGPMEVRSVGGSKYFLVLVDDYTKMAFVYFMKTKDEVFNHFRDFMNMAENHKERKIKTLRTDNGGEFCGLEFERLLNRNGIIHQKTTPYTPEQNGSSERMNRTLVEKARCLLSDSNLDKKLWAEAVNTAAYLHNRSIVASLGKTPYEMWTGKKPDISHLRIFGSNVMMHIPKEKRQKWDKKSKKTILVGYSDTVKGYRLYSPDENEVIVSRDIVIMENEDEEVPVTITMGEKNNTEESFDSVGENSKDEESDDQESYETNSVSTENSEQETSDEDYEENVAVEIPKNVRRSERRPQPKEFKDFVTYLCTEDISGGDPVTLDEALARPDGDKWKEATTDELRSFEENEAWEIVDIPESGTIVKCKWVFKRKVCADNSVRYRARLVAKGYTQKPGIDFDETFSPVVRHSTLRLLIALSVKLNLDITHLDVKTAFLNGYLKEQVFMEIPEGIVLPDKNKVLKLKKAIYGLKQSSRAWNERVNETLAKLGYKRSNFEPCLYVKRCDSLITVVALYVDDFLIFSNDANETVCLKRELSTKFEIKDLGEVKNCLGMRINIDKNQGVITLDQKDYINQLLKRFNMIDCKPAKTPLETKLELEVVEEKIDVPYQRLIGSLMYLAVLTRPDISFSVSYLSQFNNCYKETHWKCAKRILRYLQGTKDYCLKFKDDNSALVGYVDADWASNSIDRKSYTGFAFKLCSSVISWESAKQKTVALSSTEAEYMAISEAAKEAIYLRNVLSELIGFTICVALFNDNQSAQKLSINPVFHKRSKHIDVRHHFIREAISNKHVIVKYIPTNDMPADILTKSLSAEKHCKFLIELGVNPL